MDDSRRVGGVGFGWFGAPGRPGLARARPRRVVLLLALALASLPVGVDVASSASISLSAPVIAEGDDFATRVLALPWDMAVGPYPDFATVLQGVDRASFASSGGRWSFATATADPSVLLLSPSIVNTQKVLRLGDRFPIDAGKYRLLSFRLCSSANTTANVTWFYDQAPHAVFASSSYVDVQATSGTDCRVYAVDMTRIGVAEAFGGASGWHGLLKGFRLDPATAPGVSLQLDWVRLTTADTSRTVPIAWADVASGTNLFFYLAKDAACSAAGATLLGSAPRSGSTGTFHWGSTLRPNPTPGTPLPLPESFAPGQYAVFMLVDNQGPPVCAGAPLDIRAAPRLRFQKPSAYSGPDYATEARGVPWSMDSETDVDSVSDISSHSFSGGIFHALTGSSSDSYYVMDVPAPIDAARYRYLTFRMRLDGVQDIGLGWVHRFAWWYQGATLDSVVTRDMILYEGWQTYTVDLAQALLEPASLGSGWTGFPTVLRMDPHEVPAPVAFDVDFVALTAEDRVEPGAGYPIYYQLTAPPGAGVALFYDSDTDPAQGRAPIALAGTPCPPPPNPQLGLLTGSCVVWDTDGVPDGAYFISADVSDGVATTTWYSETPVLVGASGGPAASARLVNLSTRGPVRTGDGVMIGGFVIDGSSPKRVLLRVVGPSLAARGVPGALSDPSLLVVAQQTGTPVARNDDWQATLPLCAATGHVCGSAADIAATGFAPADPREPAVLITLPPGAYTAVVSGAGAATGIALVEVYEADGGGPSGDTRLVNLSTRGPVEVGDDVLIGGFVIAGAVPKQVVVRAIGPSLSGRGVAGALGNPVVRIFVQETEIADSDDWQVPTGQCQAKGYHCGSPAEIDALGLAPGDPREAAVLITLPPGPYTAVVRGVGSTTGIALVEVFEVAP